MTDKILEMAKQILGTVLINGTEYFEIDESGLEELANLIRADERINCIKIIGKELGLPDEYVAEYLSKRGE